MKGSSIITKLELDMAESQNQRDARVEQLWSKLDFQRTGALDWKGLQRGLRRIDHPMKNADSMLKDITKVVDTDGDGKIQYEEFRVFVEAAERQLFLLFQSIDHDQNGKLDKDELQLAFQRAGIAIPSRRLGQFFQEIDGNNDGYITYEEWRDFLLFMPNTDPKTTLRAVFTFYSEILSLNSEGDSVVNEETLQSIGTAVGSFLHNLFGSISQLAYPQHQPPSHTSPEALSSTSYPGAGSEKASPAIHSNSANDDCECDPEVQPGQGPLDSSTTRGAETVPGPDNKGKGSVLITYLPDPGYFVAGAVAGGISRTATAPLDRLKVYLLVNTRTGANLAANHHDPRVRRESSSQLHKRQTS